MAETEGKNVQVRSSHSAQSPSFGVSHSLVPESNFRSILHGSAVDGGVGRGFSDIPVDMCAGKSEPDTAS